MSINTNEYSEFVKKAMAMLPKGAFLTTNDRYGKINTMTIGWGSFGVKWGLPVAEVMVRESRFTKAALDESMEFTVTFPFEEEMKQALSYCGQKSGRDTDKISDCKLEIADSKTINTPFVKCKGIIMECRVVASNMMDENLILSEVLGKWYKNGDLHTIYTAEVVECYEI